MVFWRRNYKFKSLRGKRVWCVFSIVEFSVVVVEGFGERMVEDGVREKIGG